MNGPLWKAKSQTNNEKPKDTKHNETVFTHEVSTRLDTVVSMICRSRHHEEKKHIVYYPIFKTFLIISLRFSKLIILCRI